MDVEFADPTYAAPRLVAGVVPRSLIAGRGTCGHYGRHGARYARHACHARRSDASRDYGVQRRDLSRHGRRLRPAPQLWARAVFWRAPAPPRRVDFNCEHIYPIASVLHTASSQFWHGPKLRHSCTPYCARQRADFILPTHRSLNCWAALRLVLAR